MIWTMEFVDADRPFKEGGRPKVQMEDGKGRRQVLLWTFWVEAKVESSDQSGNLSDAIPD